MVDQRTEGQVPPGDRSYLSIGEVLALLQDEFPDVTISKIRFLESQGLIDPERTPSGYRKFYEIDVLRLRFILHQQKEHFLPLKVIKDRLDSGEPLGDENGRAGSEPEPAAEVEPAPEPEVRLPVWMVKPPPAPPSGAATVRSASSGATFSFEEVASSSGLTVDELRDVERFGIVIGRPVGSTTVYDEHAIVAARVAAQFLSFGIEPRHLRLYRNAADREAGLIEQLILPLLKQRNPQAHAQAHTTLDTLARLGGELREAVLRQSLRPYTG
ncbi:MAG TPA: MerR family transcriptional regulator [Acidimicrobiales bacterium]|nr:MerR family transcriptional regulator [Acidimicrobiales bacterium]